MERHTPPDPLKVEAMEQGEERPHWGNFLAGTLDVKGDYAEPTPEQKQRFQKRNERLSEIFENADFLWYLDGAVNISLYGEKQIRNHKDQDMSIFKEDIEKLNGLLARQGFGIFLNYNEHEKRMMRRVTEQDFALAEKSELSICKIGPDGIIQRETLDPFNFVDLHVHTKDADGNILVHYSGGILPKEFFEPIKKELANGKVVNLSQPAVVAYHKLHANRPYDLTDLQKLRPYLQAKDFEMLRNALKQEIQTAKKNAIVKLEQLWTELSSLGDFARDPKAVREKLWKNPLLLSRKDDPRVSAYISSISQYIAEHPDLTSDDFVNHSFSLLKPCERMEQKLQVLDQLQKNY